VWSNFNDLPFPSFLLQSRNAAKFRKALKDQHYFEPFAFGGSVESFIGASNHRLT